MAESSVWHVGIDLHKDWVVLSALRGASNEPEQEQVFEDVLAWIMLALVVVLADSRDDWSAAAVPRRGEASPFGERPSAILRA